MLQFLVLGVALIGCVIASYWDLKTTEVPDSVPYSMISAGILIYLVQSILANSIEPLANSVMMGISLFVFGYILYYFGQWGGADAKILSSIGFLLPDIPSVTISQSLPIFPLTLPFPLTYVANLFLVGTVYMFIYAFFIAANDRKIVSHFRKDVRSSTKLILFSSIALFIFLSLIGFEFYRSIGADPEFYGVFSKSAITVIATSAIFLLYKFARVVENVGFKKRIPVSDVKEGDVLMKSKVWVGIENAELHKLRSSGKKYVWIKEGVRFIPAFLLALIFTIYYGDIMFFVFGFLL